MVAAFMVASGAMGVGAHLVRRVPVGLRPTVSIVGGVVMLAGLVIAFGSMALMLFEDVYLSIRVDGLLLHENGRETLLPWDDLTQVAVLPNGVLELRREGKDALRWFAGTSVDEVAARVQQARRKAAHGLLRIGS